MPAGSVLARYDVRGEVGAFSVWDNKTSRSLAYTTVEQDAKEIVNALEVIRDIRALVALSREDQ